MQTTNRHSKIWARRQSPRLVVGWMAVPAIAFVVALSGCATLAPQQRAILADPTMQFDAEAKHDAALRHAIDNREGSMGGTGVSGGGCGCN
jgi:hypothetical protein